MHCSYVAQHSSRHRLRHSPRVSWRRPWPDAFSQRAAHPARHCRYLCGNQPVRRVYDNFDSTQAGTSRPFWCPWCRPFRAGRRGSCLRAWRSCLRAIASTASTRRHEDAETYRSRTFWQQTLASSQRPSRRRSRRVRRNVVSSPATCPQSPWQRLLLRIRRHASCLRPPAIG